MAIKGRKPKPTAQKELSGNPGKRPLNTREPQPGRRRVNRMPVGLSDGAQRLWRQMAGEMVELGMLTDADLPAFILMAEHYNIARRALSEIAEEDLTVQDQNGLLRKHPLLQVFRDNSMAFKSYAAEFGLTPSSRSRLQLPDDAQQMSLGEELFAIVAEQMASEVEGEADEE